jgi:hypothetical protein
VAPGAFDFMNFRSWRSTPANGPVRWPQLRRPKKCQFSVSLRKLGRVISLDDNYPIVGVRNQIHGDVVRRAIPKDRKLAACQFAVAGMALGI